MAVRVRTLLPLLSALLIAGPMTANAADPKQIAAAGRAVQVCAEHMPDSRAAKDAFAASGYRYEGSDGNYHYYSLNGRRVVVGTSVTHSVIQGCVVLVSKMTTAEAAQLLQPWVTAARAKPRASDRRNLPFAWEGTFKGRPAELGVLGKLNLPFVRGAAIVLRIR